MPINTFNYPSESILLLSEIYLSQNKILASTSNPTNVKNITLFCRFAGKIENMNLNCAMTIHNLGQWLTH